MVVRRVGRVCSPVLTGAVRSTSCVSSTRARPFWCSNETSTMSLAWSLCRPACGFGAEVLVAIDRAEGLLVEFPQTLPDVTLFCVAGALRPGSGTVSGVGFEVGQLRCVCPGRHVAP